MKQWLGSIGALLTTGLPIFSQHGGAESAAVLSATRASQQSEPVRLGFPVKQKGGRLQLEFFPKRGDAIIIAAIATSR